MRAVIHRFLDRCMMRLARRGEIILAGFYSEPLHFVFPPAFMRESHHSHCCAMGAEGFYRRRLNWLRAESSHLTVLLPIAARRPMLHLPMTLRSITPRLPEKWCSIGEACNEHLQSQFPDRCRAIEGGSRD